MAKTTLDTTNSGRPAPRWYRKFKKIWTNTENTALAILALTYPSESPIFLLIKIISSYIIENLDTLLANGESYAKINDEENDIDYIWYIDKNGFPAKGTSGIVYYDASTNTDWEWDAVNMIYVSLNGDRPQKPPRFP